MTEKHQARSRRKDRWLLLLVLLLFCVGLGIRGYGYISASKTDSSPTPHSGFSSGNFSEERHSATSRALLPSDRTNARQPHLLIMLAPYLTEGGLSFFIGFCIGYFLRLLTRTAKFIVGGLYCGIILLSHYGVVTVDWGQFQHIVQQLLLNTRQYVEDLRAVLTIGIPSVAMGGIGIWRGLKKP
ncbi:hypothetical protein CSB45_13860 [candidate division KSB3 bacterium]|uniref:Uncharacterized protein n=1 Tax=candidate division KSB3 bacterium TaxID=2044937 RepID=A0A2G6E2C2_9BACT|nr:MAG: hypothetical protein CSB45_13860 [candidate division KSB3 bacterium]PIE28506.1 MAG: hypothetical protein CSA57_13455 [candidate division KSB3 bacterium]